MDNVLLVGLFVMFGLLILLTYIGWKERLGRFKYWRKPPERLKQSARFVTTGFAFGDTQRVTPWAEVQTLMACDGDYAAGERPTEFGLNIYLTSGACFPMSGPITEWPVVLQTLRRYFPSISADWQFSTEKTVDGFNFTLLFDRGNRTLAEVLAADNY